MLNEMIKQMTHAELQAAFREAARNADVERLADAVRARTVIFGKRFDWSERYNAEYITQYARRHGWVLSRLNAAIRVLDVQWRAARNARRD